MGNILIIEDEKITLNGITFLIDKLLPDNNIHGTAWYHCDNGSAGLQELSCNPYKLVILDIMLSKGTMPVKNNRDDSTYGIDILEVIKIKYPQIPVICHTMVLVPAKVEEIKTLGGLYICKNENGAREKLLKQIITNLKK